MLQPNLAGILVTLQSRTGHSFNAESFESRLRIQKSIYILKALGFRPACVYSYSDYFHGPYSPNLAKDYYELLSQRLLRQGTESVTCIELPDAMLGIVEEAIRRGNDFLEAAASLHSLAARYPELDGTKLQAFLRTMKPGIADRSEEAWSFLTTNHLVVERT